GYLFALSPKFYPISLPKSRFSGCALYTGWNISLLTGKHTLGENAVSKFTYEEYTRKPHFQYRVVQNPEDGVEKMPVGTRPAATFSPYLQNFVWPLCRKAGFRVHETNFSPDTDIDLYLIHLFCLQW
ncbi:MAG: hypothetical protein ACK5NG_03295, partial [Chthoniobacterales bacterium]